MSNDQATVWATIVQAIMAVIMLFVTMYLGIRQNKSIKRQINLSLYEKRFKIYNAIKVLICSVQHVDLPKSRDEQFGEFANKIGECLQVFWKDSSERTFLIGDKLNKYVNSIEKKISDYSKLIANNPPPEGGPEYMLWFEKINKERSSLIFLIDEVTENFKICLDFKKI
ncbi:hypothetical protein ACJDU8_15695 [Clostridium sp. WILCCON 0269]|uniref:Uncharacterized protein n=1 Tax=Candidatus Clostridium eludens TaxID=3381663 RepID=A0ABW8SLT8_9CLOT